MLVLFGNEALFDGLTTVSPVHAPMTGSVRIESLRTTYYF